MLKDVLEESWAYQEMKQEGLAEGMQQGIARALESFIQQRFPDLLPLAKQQIGGIKDSEALQKMLDRLFAVQSAEEAKSVLSPGLTPKRRTKGKQSE